MSTDTMHRADSRAADRQVSALRVAGSLRLLAALAADSDNRVCIDPEDLAWLFQLLTAEARRAAAD